MACMVTKGRGIMLTCAANMSQQANRMRSDLCPRRQKREARAIAGGYTDMLKLAIRFSCARFESALAAEGSLQQS